MNDIASHERSAKWRAPSVALAFLLCSRALAQPSLLFDIADADTADGTFLRARGASGQGNLGVPVAGSLDCDGDGFNDFAVSFMTASPLGRAGAGEVDLIFGVGPIVGEFDTSINQARVLRIFGDAPSETCGTEVWMADVNNDDLGDLLIGRQNYTPSPARIGAGAMTIILGGPELRAQSQSLQPIDLRSPPPGIRIITFVGANQYDRLGIWTRHGDITGDGIDDLIVGADQYDIPPETNNGACYIIRGGSHLSASQTIDFADFGSTSIEGHVCRVTPPVPSQRFHLGATCTLGDLSGNGRADLAMAATINRAGATINPAGAPPGTAQATGGSPQGTVYIIWDENFPTNMWPIGFNFSIDASPRSRTIIDGGAINRSFGEELVTINDCDDDGAPDLFIGDLVADATAAQNRPLSGAGYVFYNAPALEDLVFDIDSPPAGVQFTTILGPSIAAIGADTVIAADFDGDGLSDIAFGSPQDDPQGRDNAGLVHVFYGQAGQWPAVIDTAPAGLPSPAVMRIAEIHGALGTVGFNGGDTLCYSVSFGDVDADGRDDLITNEMLGDGFFPSGEDAGNLIIISGAALLQAPSAARLWREYQ